MAKIIAKNEKLYTRLHDAEYLLGHKTSCIFGFLVQCTVLFDQKFKLVVNANDEEATVTTTPVKRLQLMNKIEAAYDNRTDIKKHLRSIIHRFVNKTFKLKCINDFSICNNANKLVATPISY
jgi:aerobic-type carbon monoxide dehydrogenase small subunit (CoxS/CutS family)